MVKELIAFRPKTRKFDVTPHLEALEAAGIGKDDSDRLRMGVIALTKAKRVKVGLQDEDCTKADVKFMKAGVTAKRVPV